MLVLRDADLPGDPGWMIERHGTLYAREYGWDVTFEALVARIVADFTQDPAAHGWIAELDGERAGCILCVPDGEPGVAKLRILLVDPVARGHGIGAALVTRALAWARDEGYALARLWTNDPLTSARRIYDALGFALVAEEPHHSFGADLVGQVFERALR